MAVMDARLSTAYQGVNTSFYLPRPDFGLVQNLESWGPAFAETGQVDRSID